MSTVTEAKYQFIRDLGQGGFAIVKHYRVDGGKDVAVKIIEKSNWNPQQARANKIMLDREVDVLKKLQHPNIIKLYDHIDQTARTFLFMEYVPNSVDLYEFVSNEKENLPKNTVMKIFRQVVFALKYCQENDVVHRDIKPENILVNNDTLDVKLIDFGCTREVIDKMMTPCGTPEYLSPEVISGKGYGPESDIWSLGVTLYGMATGCSAFYNDHRPTMFKNIANGQYDFPPNMGLDMEILDLIRKMIVVDPKKRLTLDQILAHPALKAADQPKSNSPSSANNRPIINTNNNNNNNNNNSAAVVNDNNMLDDGHQLSNTNQPANTNQRGVKRSLRF